MKARNLTIASFFIIVFVFASVVFAANFGAGDPVKVTSNVNVRNGPGTLYAEITDPDYPGYAPTGTRGIVESGPTAANGYNWWKINYGPWLYTGWSIENNLAKTFPDVPKGLYPGSATGPGPVVDDLTPELSWIASGGANYYQVYVSKYPYGSENIKFQNEHVVGTSVTATALEAGAKYRWDVSACNTVDNKNVCSAQSPDSYFQIFVPSSRPSAPQNLRISDVGDGFVNLAWDPPSNNGGSAVTNYKIYRGTYSGGETLYYTTATAGTTFSNTAVTNGITYYYKVTAMNSIGESSFSNEVSATPSAPLPSAPQLVNPSDGDVLTVTTPTFSWNAVSGADQYGLYVRDINTNVLVFDSERDGYTITGNSFTLPSGILQNNGNYRWNMRSHNSAGWGTTFSTARTFSISMLQPGDVPVADGFDYPVGKPHATQANDGDGWYNAQDFRVNNHLGEDWNGESGGDTDLGEPVYATAKGKVIYAQNGGTGWSNVVAIKHKLSDGSIVVSLYGHLESFSISVNDIVERGQKIGTVGKDYPERACQPSGQYCAHLHFEIRTDESAAIPGSGYNTNSAGWTDPSNFIDAHRSTVVGSCDTVNTNSFFACYYDNSDLSNLKITRTDNPVNFDWGTGSPDPQIAADTFSARWQGSFYFENSDYEFTVTSDDGFRLYIDNVLALDKWLDQPPTTYKVTKSMATGYHTIKMEYYENAGGAVAKLSWAKVVTSGERQDDLGNLIDSQAAEFYNPSWTISLQQFKAWIALIANYEGGAGGYAAHSQGALGSDLFYHSNAGSNFRFSTGIGPFQLDRGGGSEAWDRMPTIKKINPLEGVRSALRYHYNRFGSGSTLQEFSSSSPWYAVKDGQVDIASRWNSFTGTSWSTHKNTKIEDSNWASVKSSISLRVPASSYSVEQTENSEWFIRNEDNVNAASGRVIFTGAQPTWRITARNGAGVAVQNYYYTYNPDSEIEVWVYDDGNANFNNIFVRDYSLAAGDYHARAKPQHISGSYAGVTLEHEALTPGGVGGCPDCGIDADSDGYTSDIDCNDNNTNIHPGAAETCNNVDDDCDVSVDESLVQQCGIDIGVCEFGTQSCSAGLWGACAGVVEPTAETCNSVDDDCDGSTDEDFNVGSSCSAGIGACTSEGVFVCNQAGSGTICNAVPRNPSSEICDNVDNDCDGTIDEQLVQQCGSTDVGACQFGTQTCSSGTWGVCENNIEPAVETCNGIDDDCDGSADETFNFGAACSSGIGACHAAGTFVCSEDGSTIVCNASPNEPSTELCGDQIDNDCDSLTDEGFDIGSVCSAGTGACQANGVKVCSENGLSTFCNAVPGNPSAEICNNVDDDCDGATDEQLVQQCGSTDVGACEFGTQTCFAGEWSVCENNIEPISETCNSIDDDCDGTTDETFLNLGSACSEGIGACQAEGIFVCSQDGSTTVCNAVPNDPSAELCGDNVDNDCNGLTDEGFDIGSVCSAGTGACQADGTKVCSQNGLSTVCNAVAGEPSAEVCDNIDNNCNGQVDEQLVQQCGSTDIGICEFGTQSCSAGQWSACENNIEPVEEVCDDLDNNCDGAIDDGNVCPVCRKVIYRTNVVGSKYKDKTWIALDQGQGMKGYGYWKSSASLVSSTCSDAVTKYVLTAPDGSQVRKYGDSLAYVCTSNKYFLYTTSDPDAKNAFLSSNPTEPYASSNQEITITCTSDRDNDGYFENDCNDSNANIHPGATETCNNADDDCDSSIDESLTQRCGTTDVGVCEYGTQTCSAGVWVACVGNVEPSSEICDNVDNDCDGITDEAFSTGASCSTGTGACYATGTLVCNQAGDGTVCNAIAGEPAAETCNSIDDDCDGTVDESGVCACQKVIYRTNVVGNKYKDKTWIAVDQNGDEKLEGYGYFGSYSSVSISCRDPYSTYMFTAPDGSQVRKASANTIYICTPKKYYIYASFDSDASKAVLNAIPTSPYTSNNQEIVKTC